MPLPAFPCSKGPATNASLHGAGGQPKTPLLHPGTLIRHQGSLDRGEPASRAPYAAPCPPGTCCRLLFVRAPFLWKLGSYTSAHRPLVPRGTPVWPQRPRHQPVWEPSRVCIGCLNCRQIDGSAPAPCLEAPLLRAAAACRSLCLPPSAHHSAVHNSLAGSRTKG